MELKKKNVYFNQTILQTIVLGLDDLGENFRCSHLSTLQEQTSYKNNKKSLSTFHRSNSHCF